jgi:hypothetical protein
MSNKINILDAKISLQRALLGAISSDIRAITIELIENEVIINYYFDGAPTEEDNDVLSIVETEVLADFHYEDNIVVKSIFHQCKSPLGIEAKGFWIFHRRE